MYIYFSSCFSYQCREILKDQEVKGERESIIRKTEFKHSSKLDEILMFGEVTLRERNAEEGDASQGYEQW